MKDSATALEVFKALGDEHRLKILTFIATSDPACCSTGDGICACDVIDAVGLAQATVSHHVKILSEAGLVSGEKRDRWVYYSLNRKGFKETQSAIEAYLKLAPRDINLEVVT